MAPLFLPFIYVTLLIVPLAWIFGDSVMEMASKWGDESYSHAYLLPFVALYLAYLRVPRIKAVGIRPCWIGVVLVVLGLGLGLLGELGTLYSVMQYAFLITIYGLLLAVLGWPAFRQLSGVLLLLLFLVPLPNFLYNNFSAWLQLMSSQLGVGIIRLFGIGVFLEGNVIDLGPYKLEVAEACSGLRYLFPLMSLGFIAAYIFRGSWWQKAVLFLSTMPISILMNSFRIGIIGVLVEYWGKTMAEGFLHDFEGWIVFMGCAVLLLVEMWVFVRLRRERLSLAQSFVLEAPPAGTIDGLFSRTVRRPAAPYWASLFLLLLMAAVFVGLPERRELVPERTAFADFPVQLGNWSGRQDQLTTNYLDALKLDDYILTEYVDGKGASVEFYSAWYGSQRRGQSAHSPRTCLPGGGWQLTHLQQVALPDLKYGGKPLRVNRTLIQMGDEKILVYYWFQQRGRDITSEYMVKWYLYYDALTRNRTDGALLRLTTSLATGEDVAAADARIQSLLGEILPRLPAFVPD